MVVKTTRTQKDGGLHLQTRVIDQSPAQLLPRTLSRTRTLRVQPCSVSVPCRVRPSGFLPLLLPSRARPLSLLSSSPPPTRHHGGPKVIHAEEIAEYLNHPHTLLRKQFQYSPPRGGDEDYRGTWSLVSYTTQVREDQIDHEFIVSLEALDGATVPMGPDEVVCTPISALALTMPSLPPPSVVACAFSGHVYLFHVDTVAEW
ncbi:hypothetical protein NUW54_g13953 [Trametes sanguinea]|uniref:Uncharacterized protein n=1 Tax=Trametes sanguinea TaxID=158606 RepID=A0ACC1MGX7_9APHY|nr:hypothetical protein NUW54_g13953 [Trametes sanguinea]